ncbi:Phospholipase C 2 [Mycobacterium persicum]|uniref:Phospholipase C 2 n=1 Tax=Mycobacterium persicum TaxID=1487726 RepID=A0AB38V071_9MYCO|nr:Phospholipase C 2 [Mycobacterium persicum]
MLTETTPNRLYWISATIDPDGTQGGPVLADPIFLPVGKFSWTIMPQNLSAAGVSWKVYQNKGPLNEVSIGIQGWVKSFKQAQDPRSDLARYGIAPAYPIDFAVDVLENKLPNVSWLVPGYVFSEHPSLPVSAGAVAIYCCQIRRFGKRPR